MHLAFLPERNCMLLHCHIDFPLAIIRTRLRLQRICKVNPRIRQHSAGSTWSSHNQLGNFTPTQRRGECGEDCVPEITNKHRIRKSENWFLVDPVQVHKYHQLFACCLQFHQHLLIS